MTSIHNGPVRIQLVIERIEETHDDTLAIIQLDHRPPSISHVPLQGRWYSDDDQHDPPGDNWAVVEHSSAISKHRGNIQGIFTGPIPTFIGIRSGIYRLSNTFDAWFELPGTTCFHHDPESGSYIEMEP